MTLRWSAVALLLLTTAPIVEQAHAQAPAMVGDAQRGRAVFVNRTQGNCLSCHQAPIPEEDFHGTVGPNLAGVGRRLSAAMLWQRVADARSLNPESVMPSFYTTTGRMQVDPAYIDRPILSAQQVQDVVAYLLTLTEEP